MSSNSFAIGSVSEMQALGQRIGSHLLAGDVLLLKGELGAGKTALTRGIGESLGLTDISSPTFVISKIHPGKIPFIHVDAYRLRGSEIALFDDLDLESRIPGSITVIEWGSGFVERLVSTFITVNIEFGATETDRIVSITGLDL
jgi:tRNA threonylcarbamoyladenosine biosynthesis protein TsaE